MNENVLADLQLGVAKQAQVRGQSDQRAGGGVAFGNVFGERIEPTLLDRRKLGEGSLAAQEALVAAPHAVAHLQFLHFRTDGLDHARQVATNNERTGQLHGIRPRSDVRVDRVDGDGLDVNEGLAA